jgi:hypothetical protein
MDKLQPLIKHRFWILFGLAFPLTLAGYYTASGSMKQATLAREELLTKTRTGVPQGTSEPNEDYAQKLSKINEELAARNRVQVQKLWQSQIARMTWPPQIVPHIPNEYRGDVSADARYNYMNSYPDIIRELWEGIEPYVGNPPPPGMVVEWPQKVVLFPEKIPRKGFDPSSPPSSKEIWDAQEDVWLLTLLFDAVVRTNREATFVGDAFVRRIDTIKLMGGSGTSTVAPAAAASPAGDASYGGGGYDGGYGGEVSADGGAGYGESFGGLGGTNVPTNVAFNVAEEFGQELPEPEEAAAATAAPAAADAYGGGAASSYGGSADGGYGSDYGGSDYGGAMGGIGGLGGKPAFRYIGDPAAVDSAPFRERGFYASVIVMQSEIPRFFGELCSSDWPIRIERFHVGPNPYYTETQGTPNIYGGGMGMLGMAGGGYGESYGGGFTEGSTDGGYGGAYNPGGYDGAGSSYGGIGGLGGSFAEMGPLGGFGGLGGAQLQPLGFTVSANVDPVLLAHPNLVQLDFCGRITMYNPLLDDTLAPTADESFEESAGETPPAEASEGAGQPPAETTEGVAEPPVTDEPSAPTAEPAPPETPPAAETTDESAAVPNEN